MAPKKKKDAKDKEKDDDEVELNDEDRRDQALAALFKSANKNFGAGSLFYAEDDKFKVMQRIPTGILPLDYAMGGGVPVGRISLFYGHKSTAKTTNILRIIGNAQRMCSDCWTQLVPVEEGSEKMTCKCKNARRTVVAWLDTEGVWEHDWAAKFVKIDESLLLSKPSSAEETIDLAHAALKAEIDVLVIDSIAFMTSMVEQEKSSQEMTVGLQARLVGQAMRKFVSTINELGKAHGRRPTIILTNQIRMKVGVMYGNPETVPGGLAAGFATSIEVKTSAGKYDIDDYSGKPIMVENKAKITKNKTAPPQMEVEWKVALMKTEVKSVGSILDEDWAFDMGEKSGLVSVAPQKVEWGGKTFRGRSLLEKFWMDNPTEYAKFKGELLPVLLAV